MGHCQNLAPLTFNLTPPFITHSEAKVIASDLVPSSKLIPQGRLVAFKHVTQFLFAFVTPFMRASIFPSLIELIIAIWRAAISWTTLR